MRTTLFSLFFCIFSIALAGQYNSLELLDGKRKAEAKFEFQHNFILLEVRFNNFLPLRFLYDTGAEYTILFKKDYADLLGLKYERKIKIIGSDMSRELYAYLAQDINLKIEGLGKKKDNVLVLEDDYFHLDELTGVNIDGIIGASYFRNLVIDINYKKSLLTFSDPKYFREPSKRYEKIPIKVIFGRPYVDATTTLQNDQTVDVRLLIDTGAGLPILLHTNTHPDLKLPDHYIKGKLGMGLGGYLEGYMGKIEQLNLGNLTFRNTITSFQDLNETILVDEKKMRNGLLGNQMLSRFYVIIDFNKELLYLRPVGNYQKGFRYDRSGLVIFALGHQLNDYIIQDVVEGSPAFKAGLQKGDVLKRLQYLPSKFYTLNDIYRIFQGKIDKKIKMVVLRGDERLKFNFYLKDLI